MFWVTKLMGYDYEIIHKGSNTIAANALSRMPKMELLQITLPHAPKTICRILRQDGKGMQN